MAKDYAKKRQPNKRGASRQNKKARPPLGLWALAFIMLATLAAGLIYIKWYHPKKTSSVAAQSTQKKAPTNEAASAQPKVDDSVPIYNIHEDLTNKQVLIPAEDLQPSESLEKYYYQMPCGSFRERERAEELKAMIGMAGHNSTINLVEYKGEKWHRVEVGPFNRKRQAEKIRHRLQDNNIQECRIIPKLK